MIFEYHGNEYRLPVTLRDITLQQRIAFDQEHGKDLAALAADIDAKPSGEGKHEDMIVYHAACAVRAFSFFSGISLQEVEDHFDLQQVMDIYETTLSGLLNPSGDLLPTEGIWWEGERWTIQTPELRPDSPMVFNEFLVAKESVRQLVSMDSGRWETVPYLAAVYLRNDREPFSEDLVHPDGDRLRLMQRLPMDIAACVAFFLTSTAHSYTISSQSSEKRPIKGPILKNTLSAGVGYPSLHISQRRRCLPSPDTMLLNRRRGRSSLMCSSMRVRKKTTRKQLTPITNP